MWNSTPGKWMFCLCLLVAPVVADVPPEEKHPLSPADLSSPRATLQSFMQRADGIAAMLGGEYWHDPSRELAEQIRQREAVLLRMLDLSEVPPASRADSGTDALVHLYEVLSRIELPPEEEIPGAEAVDQLTVGVAVPDGETDRKRPKVLPQVPVPEKPEPVRSISWTIPHTEITLERVAEGPQAGQFIFSADTVARAGEFYQRVQHLPYRRDVPLKHYAEMRRYLSKGGWLVSSDLVQSLPGWLKRQVLKQAMWKWLVMIATLLAAAALVVAVHRRARRVRGGIPGQLARFAVPVLLLLFASPLANFIDQQLTITGRVAQGLTLTAEVITYFSLAWLVWLAPQALAESYIHSSRVQGESLNAHLLRFVARTVGVVGIITIVFLLSSRLGAPLFSLIVGFGVGGVAVALAAQSSIENFMGSLNLFGDKPVRIGDFCRYGEDAGPDYQRIGTVESIGMRSTRIRGLDRTLTTIPNADFCKMPIVNYTQRSQVALVSVISLRYETSDDQLRYVLANLRDLLLMHPRVDDEEPSVRLIGIGDSGFEVEMRVDINTADFVEFRAIREDILLRALRIVRDAGTNFAVPSRTLYFSRDPGLDSERRGEVESRVRAWAAAQQMPFPYFSADYRHRNRDTLDYPPEGSPDAQG